MTSLPLGPKSSPPNFPPLRTKARRWEQKARPANEARESMDSSQFDSQFRWRHPEPPEAPTKNGSLTFHDIVFFYRDLWHRSSLGEKWKKGPWLFRVYVEITTNHYKDPSKHLGRFSVFAVFLPLSTVNTKGYYYYHFQPLGNDPSLRILTPKLWKQQTLLMIPLGYPNTWQLDTPADISRILRVS